METCLKIIFPFFGGREGGRITNFAGRSRTIWILMSERVKALPFVVYELFTKERISVLQFLLKLILLRPNYFMPKVVCLPTGPIMSFPLFSLVWNACSKWACRSGECFTRQFHNMDHIWGLIGARRPSSPFPSLPGYLHLQFRF